MFVISTARNSEQRSLLVADNQKGLLGLIFNKSENKFDSAHPWASAFGRAARAQIRSRRICQDPAKLRRLVVDLIGDGRGIESQRFYRWADQGG